ncbi:MAG: hypothetical protein KA248_15060 [Kiritimatiellae bacterium]|nr:hypothetical protein [Kiritimatiellia bacterium]
MPDNVNEKAFESAIEAACWEAGDTSQAVATRMAQNEDITARFMNEEDFRRIVGQHLTKQVYDQINQPAAPPQ